MFIYVAHRTIKKNKKKVDEKEYIYDITYIRFMLETSCVQSNTFFRCTDGLPICLEIHKNI